MDCVPLPVNLLQPNHVAYATPPKITGRHSDAPSPLPPKRIVTVQDRQRSQRVLLRVRAKIHVALQGSASTLDVLTLSVSPQGAMVILKQSLPAETRLVLEHAGTRRARRMQSHSLPAGNGGRVSRANRV